MPHLRGKSTTERYRTGALAHWRIADFGPIIDNWLPLTFALNSMSRSMGQVELYPFVLSAPAIEN